MSTNIHGQYTDTPVEKAWICRFDVLFIRRDHRRILNRQPELQFWNFSNGYGIAQFIIDHKVMSN
uniref:Uncharacterized protein n=1 Tax=viral metagenome TaxID=1070528 RepID=A0A6M3LY64_9ZZZZ